MSAKKLEKYRKRIISLLLLLLALAVGWLMEALDQNHIQEQVANAINPDAAMMSLHIIDVGQGSSTLLQTKNGTILIDGGDVGASEQLLDYLVMQNVKKLDMLVVTHPHTDHYGGIISVLEKFEVTSLLLPAVGEDILPTNDTYDRFLAAVEDNGCEVNLATEPKLFNFGEVKLAMLDAFVKDPSNLNDTSLCFKIEAGEASFLITGDGETAVEDALRKSSDINSDVLVAGHHGSATSSRPKFLNAVTPEISAISAGKNNSYGLPNNKTLERLAAFGQVLRTDLQGDIVFVTDGVSIMAVAADGYSKVISAKG